MFYGYTLSAEVTQCLYPVTLCKHCHPERSWRVPLGKRFD